MNKKALLCLFLFLSGSTVFCQWTEELKNLIGRQDDAAAIRLLEPLYEQAEEFDRAVLCALLAFVNHRQERKAAEYGWIVRYFEEHWGRPVSFKFKSARTGEEFLSFLTFWKERYPFVTDIHLIDPRQSAQKGPPDKLVIGLEVERAGLYKLKRDGKVLAGSRFLPGYNTLSLPVVHLFDTDGSLSFQLEIKSGDFLLTKNITLAAEIQGSDQIIRAENSIKDPEFRIQLLFNGQTFVDSRKRRRQPSSARTDIDFNVPYKNYDPEKRPDPLNQSFSILSAVGLATHLVRSLVNRDKYEPLPPLRKVRMLELAFSRMLADGAASERRVIVRLRVETEGLRLYGKA